MASEFGMEVHPSVDRTGQLSARVAFDPYAADDFQAIVTAWLPLPDAVAAILAGKLHNGHTIAGLLAGYVAGSQGFRGLRPADAAELPGLPERGQRR